ncbi:DUF2238 domain-containing protein [Pseudomonas viridiflava]|uniref:DUF2238 domain-containing protein n=1 Tax=Pseudomonas viridiflava TaxID=33069 RepID=UPI001FD351B0|nr:DUF2238 domain-containing protein [Pseudomonas viridiflava]MEE4103532.1 DUF2238 domain-containing protein [Pseudomonas viridiflava]
MSKHEINVIRALQAAFLIVVVLLGWAPLDRKTWLMENSVVALCAAALWFCRHRFYWTTRSWALVLAFVGLHEVGTHFTYPQVPYDAAILKMTGVSIDQLFGWQRNQYDRFVHLAYGVLGALPLREIVTVKCRLQGAWASLIAWSLVLSTSMLYELMEWIGGASFGQGGSAFVGAQDDFWDAQKDMAAAAAGSLLVLVCRGHAIREKTGVSKPA